MSALPDSPQETAHPNAVDLPPRKARRRMSASQRILFFLTAWLICLMPFLFWWNTWFGRQLSDKQLNEYLRDDKKPRHMQHALVQIGERMTRHDASVARWYPEVLRLAFYPVEEVRNTDAWVMGQDTSAAGFHDALLKMLNDSSQTVRGNAALSLVRFGDASGRSEIVALLQPAEVKVPTSGQVGPAPQRELWSDPGRSAQVVDTAALGTTVREGGVVAKLSTTWFADGTAFVELRSPIAGRLRAVLANRGQTVHPGDVIATIDPGTEQVWEALRALYVIGQPDDLAAILPYERELPDISDRIRHQAALTEKAIRERTSR